MAYFLFKCWHERLFFLQRENMIPQKAKVDVKPGITGYTQAYYRNGLTVREKRLKDAWYANNVTFGLDLKIFFKTIVTVLKSEKIYTNDPGVSKDDLIVDGENDEEKDQVTPLSE